jgi:hypothetical protein
MNRRAVSVLFAAVITVLWAASPVFGAQLAANDLVKLPTGRTAKILSVSKIEYSKGVMALMVRYETSLSMDDRRALSEEVDDVWKVAQKDVEHYGYEEAIVSSNEQPKGIFITANRMLNFIYEKGADGKWTRLNRAEFMAAQ